MLVFATLKCKRPCGNVAVMTVGAVVRKLRYSRKNLYISLTDAGASMLYSWDIMLFLNIHSVDTLTPKPI